MRSIKTLLLILASGCCGGVAYTGHAMSLCASAEGALMADAFVKSDTAKCNVLDMGSGALTIEIEDEGSGGLHAARLPCDISALPNGKYTADVHGETVKFEKPLTGVDACSK